VKVPFHLPPPPLLPLFLFSRSFLTPPFKKEKFFFSIFFPQKGGALLDLCLDSIPKLSFWNIGVSLDLHYADSTQVHRPYFA